GPKARVRAAGWSGYLVLLKTPSYVLNTLGMTGMTFALGGLAAWMPTYIYEREGRFLLTPEVFQELKVGGSSFVEPVPEPILERLKPLRDKEFHPIRVFEDELKKALGRDEMQKYAERIMDSCCSPSLGRINLIFG